MYVVENLIDFRLESNIMPYGSTPLTASRVSQPMIPYGEAVRDTIDEDG